MEIILASSNPNKIKEVKELLSGLDVSIISMLELGYLDNIEEYGKTFKENAYIKAKTIYDVYHKPVLSDDSGLEVDYLNGAPGIYSARYSGNGSAGNRTLLLKNLEGVTNRKADFTCVLCLYESESNVNYFEGYVYGEIDTKETGSNGFGYDSIFLYNGKSMACMSDDEKNKISHRGNAFKKLIEYLNNKN